MSHVATATEQTGRYIDAVLRRFQSVRGFSERIAAPLSAEDCAMQTMPDVSPTRWHLAHTTWFFETFLLRQLPGYEPFDPCFESLFNSYYNAVGQQFPRDRRGTISRPGLAETLDYRQHVDRHVSQAIQAERWSPEQMEVLELGCQHEQQHQELMLTDIKHVLYHNPLYPAYMKAVAEEALEEDPQPASSAQWLEIDEHIVQIGATGDRFSFDNELPRHRQLVPAHRLATRLVRNQDYLEFMDDGGYRRPELWLSLGWMTVQQEQWTAPLYWDTDESGCIMQFRLDGRQQLDPGEPVCHVSYFEADAFARWAGSRLPTEFEWEADMLSHAVAPPVAGCAPLADHLLLQGRAPHPRIERADGQFLGNVWQWTSSHYSPYPGFRAAEGALGEYNGKFMCNQFVLRGGSCATSSDHIRPSYRNFFPPAARWQFSGIRLAR